MIVDAGRAPARAPCDPPDDAMHTPRPVASLRSVATLLLLGLLAATRPSPAAGQAPSRTPTELARIARDIMRSGRFATLITRDARGAASSRTIDPLLPDSSFVVRFATNPRSRKVGELGRDPRVTLHYFAPEALAYVSLQGRARVVLDPAEKRRHWKRDWAPHYADRDSSILIVEVIPVRLELVSVRDGVMGDAATWAPPSIVDFPRRRR